MPGWAKGLCPARSSLSLLDVDLAHLAQSGKRLILLDVDNTILPWRSESLPQSSLDWIARAKAEGLELCILSNTRHPERLDRIATKLGVKYLRGRFKPNPAMYRQALKDFGVRPEQSVMIGDQLFTDILGANRAGIEGIWIRPMTSRDFIGTKVSRLGEKLVRPALYQGLSDEPEAPMPSEAAEADAEADLPPGGAGAMVLLQRPVVRQFVKFCIVGGSSTAIDVGLHGLLLFGITWGGQEVGVVFGRWLMETLPGIFGFAAKPVDASVPVLKVFTASLAILNSFYWNRVWTFNIRGREERAAQLRKFIAVALVGMALNTLITTALYHVVPGHPKRSWAIATAVATVAVAFWNFTGQKLWTFKKRAS